MAGLQPDTLQLEVTVSVRLLIYGYFSDFYILI